jgi:hypothetical protein
MRFLVGAILVVNIGLTAVMLAAFAVVAVAAGPTF